MIAFRLLVLIIAAWGTSSAIEHAFITRSWFAPINGLLLLPNAWLLLITWGEIIEWWRLQIMTPAILHEASIASTNFTQGRRPFGPDTTLWEEPL